MPKNSLKTSGHADFSLRYHIVFVTKHRQKCLTVQILEEMRAKLAAVCSKWRCELEEFNGEADHVHLLVSAHPAMNLSSLVGNLKTVSARYARALHAEHLKRYYWKNIFWSSSYAVLSVGETSCEAVVNYIRSQESPA